MCGRFYIDDHTIKEIANVAPEINDIFNADMRGKSVLILIRSGNGVNYERRDEAADIRHFF